MSSTHRLALAVAGALALAAACAPPDDASVTLPDGLPDDAFVADPPDDAPLPSPDDAATPPPDTADDDAATPPPDTADDDAATPPPDTADDDAATSVDVPFDPPEDAAAPDDAGAPEVPVGEPDTSRLGDTPYFTTGAELCGYVNDSRTGSSGHERYRGGPDEGYHTTRTWPLTFAIDDGLMAEARAEALRLAAGGGAAGSSEGDGLRYRRIWVDGVNSADYRVTALDEPGDWDVAYFKSGLIHSAGAARQWLYYHDPGGAGPVLRRVGCGGADAAGGGVWWVVLLRP